MFKAITIIYVTIHDNKSFTAMQYLFIDSRIVPSYRRDGKTINTEDNTELSAKDICEEIKDLSAVKPSCPEGEGGG